MYNPCQLKITIKIKFNKQCIPGMAQTDFLINILSHTTTVVYKVSLEDVCVEGSVEERHDIKFG